MCLKFIGFSLLFFLSACADSTQKDPVSTTSDPTPMVLTQPIVDQGTPNWLIAGGSFTEIAGGTDGEPDLVSSRFVLDGENILDAAAGHGQWVVVGNGTLQALDTNGERVREVRTALNGQPIRFIEPSSTGWAMGGDEGRFQRLDTQGEPTADQLVLLNGARLVGTAARRQADGTEIGWLVMSEPGFGVVVNASFNAPVNPAGNLIVANEQIRAVVSDGDTWVVFSDSGYTNVSATGFPSGTGNFTGANMVNSATYVEATDSILVGLSDGSVLNAPYDTLVFSPAVPVLSSPIRKIVPGGAGEWAVVGESGQVAVVNDAGTIIAADTNVGVDQRVVSAYFNGTDWMFVVGPVGLVQYFSSTLAALGTAKPAMGTETVRGGSVGATGTLLVGSGGTMQLVDELGGAVSVPESIHTGNLNDASWNGDVFIVVGDAGFTQLVDENGATMGPATTLLNGENITFVSWSGEFWLVGTDTGEVQRLLADGSPSGAVSQILDSSLNAAKWNGSVWLVVGTTTTTGNGGFATVTVDPSAPEWKEVPSVPGSFFTVENDGREFVAGGSGGLVQRISSVGEFMGAPFEVFNGLDIRAIGFNGVTFMIGGEFGAIRRVGSDFLPLRTAIGSVGGNDVNFIGWTKARGFSRGPCLTNDLCYAGPCVGGIVTGQCCDRACDKPCESCFENETGVVDGVCAPIAAGRRPPNGCNSQSESTCGLSGVCDGTGECAFHDTDVECAAPACDPNGFAGGGMCDGSGACDIPGTVVCSPYVGCSDSGCATSCSNDADCVTDYVCTGGACVEFEEPIEMEPPVTEDPDDSGCCSTTRTRSVNPGLFALLILGILFRRRRNR